MKKILSLIGLLFAFPLLVYAATYNGTATGPELDYVSGVTSGIQAQINAKLTASTFNNNSSSYLRKTGSQAQTTGIGTSVQSALDLKLTKSVFDGYSSSKLAKTASSFSGTSANATNVGITDDTTTNATMYPLWVTGTTGNLPAKISSSKLSFNPSTGVLTATGGIATGAASTGVSATGSNGSVTFLGLGDGQDEDLKLDFNTTANKVLFTSSTGVRFLNYSTIGLETTGSIKGKPVFNTYSSAQTLTQATHANTVVQMTVAGEITLWSSCTLGEFVTLWARDAEKIEVVPPSGGHFNLFNGTALTADNELDMAATAGTKVTLMCTGTNTWSVYSETAACADGGAPD